MAKHAGGRPSNSVIYALTDDNGNVRYVGQTKTPSRRRWQHSSLSNNMTNRRVSVWIRQLLSEAKLPVFSIIETTTNPDKREKYWIKHYRSLGCDLLNMNEGGHTMTHTIKAKELNAWAGTLSPLQRRLSNMRRSVTYFKARGLIEYADQVKSMLATLQIKLRSPETKKRVNEVLFERYGY